MRHIEKRSAASLSTRQALRARPGEPFPLGATWDGRGTNFSVFSEVASRIELCLFSPKGAETRIDLPDRTAFCWNGYIPGVKPGQRYGYRVYGPWNPEAGDRCNPSKLLIDPYAKAIAGELRWNAAVFPYPMGGDDLRMSDADSAPFMPRSVVIDPRFDWDGDRRPRRPLHETIVYELHVKGFTKRHPGIPEKLRGTFAGLAHPAAIEYLTSLGVTAVELLPIHHFVHSSRLVEEGRRNYWGYDSIGFFTPMTEYASSRTPGGLVNEFKAMVKALHAAGLEVILDVVYNHTAEGNHLGPVLSFKGFDNRSYYRTMQEDPRYYIDYTGTGNTLNMSHPSVLQLAMDSLRYWVVEMHVDGFRFDLASTLARSHSGVDRLSAFFDIIHQDPVLNRVKLIAEPWDIGAGGYQVGNFPVLWCEWNGKYRDTVRDYWRGEERTLPEFADRLTGSSDLYQDDGRHPYASLNFVTSHDGFTLHDLVSYNDKHNEANGEDNRDGESHNRSWNCGAEGPVDDPAINRLRAQQQRNFLATLFLSQGIPMLLGGDECGRTQDGNNNAYCQDNELSWLDWEHADRGLLDFTRRLIDLRNRHPVFRRRKWFKGRQIRGLGVSDIAWFKPDGSEMTDEDWNEGFAKSLAVFFNGDGLLDVDERAAPLKDDSFLLVFNAHFEAVTFTLPPASWGETWKPVLTTTESRSMQEAAAGQTLDAAPRSVTVLSRPSAGRR